MLSRQSVKPIPESSPLRKPIYLDYAATTPVAPEVAEAMMTCMTLTGNFANPASRSHAVSYTHLRGPRDYAASRMPSSA